MPSGPAAVSPHLVRTDLSSSLVKGLMRGGKIDQNGE